jgi:hypothetical protein
MRDSGRWIDYAGAFLLFAIGVVLILFMVAVVIAITQVSAAGC